MVNVIVIKQRLKQLANSLRKIEKYRAFTLDEFIQDEVAQDVVEYNLFIAINMMIDIATHIVVDNNMGNPDTLGDAFTVLNKENYLGDGETIIYKNMVGLRNILAHEYLKIDKEIIFSILQNNLVDFKKFIVFINDTFV
ncbi:DUF86 domain-containing protein [Tissierella sp. Yu-01]|uniref:type VII toxin-antitoxin system HepT family RNase toxin n=1 Tax=Tissierella sp. Yu-01 TaxID=3035694 RepID=UPI00240D7AC1|nr:DUF86 domain-containing protein [Tissierella sp. Yu-01]WFA08592.1 DUF86 domain-containing protein [Tissierella sp. Yu-01]